MKQAAWFRLPRLLWGVARMGLLWMLASALGLGLALWMVATPAQAKPRQLQGQVSRVVDARVRHQTL
jgi:enoyl-CoA hydratase/carnithine racemase